MVGFVTPGRCCFVVFSGGLGKGWTPPSPLAAGAGALKHFFGRKRQPRFGPYRFKE